MKLVLAQLLCIALSTIAGASEVLIETEELSAGLFRISMASDKELEISEAQKALFDTAVVVCSGQAPRFGKYKFESTVPINGSADKEAEETFHFSQEIHCGSATPANSGKAIVLDEKTEEELKDKVVNLTDKYFELLDDDGFAAAYAMQSAVQQELSSLDAWSAKQATLKRTAGKRLKTSLWRITVYKDPADAALPGNYVAVDYESEYKNFPVFCGYVIWHQSAVGELTLMREEFGYIDSATLVKIPENDLPGIKKQIGCAAT
jgi:hypothetical protein